MAIEQGTETVTVTSQERTWRVNIETAMGADPVVTAFRETIRTASDGSVISKEPAGSTERRLSAVETQSFTVNGKAYTGAEIADIIAAVADTWRQQDIAAVAEAPADNRAEKLADHTTAR
jgi:hypothetical protein